MADSELVSESEEEVDFDSLCERVSDFDAESDSAADGDRVTDSVCDIVAESDRVGVGVNGVVVVEQFSTLVDPVMDAVCVPFGQGKHVDEFVASVALEYVSSGHGVGSVEFSGQKCPLGQGVHHDEFVASVALE